ncbi:MAG: S41 family peptidase [Oscillospiraceae bacterium]|jgi:carboxyl-terminal processing protease|nr:S41 family peptidase [Oscillospiraceae bacterium]
MKKRVNVITVAVLMALTGLVTFVITSYGVRFNLNQQLEIFSRQRQEWAPFYAALDDIQGRYIGDLNTDKLMQGAIDGMVRGIGDRWSHYFDPDAFRLHLESQGNQSIGIGVTVEPGEGGIRIVEVIPGSPAAEAGLLKDDLITHVNGLSVAETGYDAAVDAVRGEEFTVVALTLERSSEGEGSFTVDIMRRTVLREPVLSRVLETPDGRIGYIRITNFDDPVDSECIDKLNELLLDNVAGLIFDVRDNPGGKLPVLERILDYLLPAGDLITLRYKDGRIDVRVSGPECVELPIAVMIDRDSVSAAEFFAACLREYDWAVLVGEKTGGKGYAQEYFRLSDGSGLYLSTSEYFTSKGLSLAGAGLTPDVEAVLSEDERRHIGSGDPALDRQLAKALEILLR